MSDTVYSLGDQHADIQYMQRALNEILNLSLQPDGEFGKVTQAAVARYQELKGFSEKDDTGACYGQQCQALLKPYIEQRFLTESDFEAASQLLSCSIAQIKAVTVVEAKKYGFLDNAFPVILFERHKFYDHLRQLRGAARAAEVFRASPNLCNTDPGGYLGGMAEVTRYNKATAIDEECAQLSTSWGLFQIMGFNAKYCGYDKVAAFVEDMKISEDKQLLAFCKFLLHPSNASLLKALQTSSWETFAKLYNGPAFKKNKYDDRLAMAENNYKAA